jgi:hypothetical protein
MAFQTSAQIITGAQVENFNLRLEVLCPLSRRIVMLFHDACLQDEQAGMFVIIPMWQSHAQFVHAPGQACDAYYGKGPGNCFSDLRTEYHGWES